MTTKWTAIRGRLAIRGAANRPPWGGRKAGHGSIVAPFATTVAATLAATMVVGLGVVLARVERNRRSTGADSPRDRRFPHDDRELPPDRQLPHDDRQLPPDRQLPHDREFALLPAERLGGGLRRMAIGQLDFAIALLAGDAEVSSFATAVHETRKSLKRLRALMRLIEHELSETAFAREDAVLRNAGLRLAGARDSEVMVSTLDGLLERHPGKLARRRGVVRLRARLVAERDIAAERALGDAAARLEVLDELRALRDRVADWRLPDREGTETVELGLERLYGQGRRRYRLAARGKGDVERAMHRWRKRVKDLRYAAEMLDRKHPAGGEGAEGGGLHRGKRRRHQKQAESLRRLARGADELAELLGEEHDLGLLAERLRAGGTRSEVDGLEVGGGTRRILLKLIARRRRRVRRSALRKGERMYRRTPKRFVRRVGDVYARTSGL